MPRLLPRSIFWQLVLATLLVQAGLLAAYISYIVVFQRHASQERIRQRTLEQIDNLQPVCERLLADGDLQTLQETLVAVRTGPTVDQARVTDLSGRTLAISDPGRDRGLDRYERALLGTRVQRRAFRISNGQLEAVTPVLQNGQTVALLWLEPNHSLSLSVANQVVRISVTYGALALLLNILPIFLVVRTMTRPLLRLREATRRLARNPEAEEVFPLPVTTGNEAGELTRTVNQMVHDLKQQRTGLLDTLALLDSMLHNAPIGLAFLDHDLRYARINRCLRDLYDLPADLPETPGGLEIAAGPLAQGAERWIREVFATGQPIRDIEISDATPGESVVRRTVLMHFYPVTPGHDAVRWVGVIAVDITGRREAEEALRKSEKLAATGRLAASIAHEINNPLEAITNLLYLLAMDPSLDPAAREFVTTAQSELSRVSEITQQTLRFYRQSTLPAPSNLVDVAESVLSLYQPRLTRAEIAVTRRFRGEPAVFGFGGELRQVFANLIGNSVDALPNGGSIILSIRRSCGLNEEGQPQQGVRVWVSDTGSGMSEATRQRIFEAFFTTKETTGTGLGLWVSQEIIRKHGGSVRVRSRRGTRSGTSFMLFFPDRFPDQRSGAQTEDRTDSHAA